MESESESESSKSLTLYSSSSGIVENLKAVSEKFLH